MRKRGLILWLFLCTVALTIGAQHITHRFNLVSMSEALKYVQSQTDQYRIIFIYNELEDFSVTADVRGKSVPEAIRQLIGFYPIAMTVNDRNEIYVECTHKTDRRLIGRLVNEKGDPLEYANIIVMNPQDSTIITHGVSNASGIFVIPVEQNKVIARMSYVGYKTVYKTCNPVRIGTIKMQPEVTVLQEAVVTAPKMQVERDGTNYTLYSLDGTVMGNAGNVLDLLRWAPGVMVDANDVISVIGRGMTEVYVNDRRIANKSELKTLSSQDIKRVEVIRDPDAQYASSTTAVIKLFTHNSIKNNLGASLTEVLDFKHKTSSATTLTIDGKYNKLSGNLSFSYNRNYSNSSNWQSTRANSGTKNDTTRYAGRRDDYRVFAGINYAFTPKSVLGFQYNGDYSKTDIDLHVLKLFKRGNNSATTSNVIDMLLNTENHSYSASYSWQRNEDSRLLLIADYAVSFQTNEQEILAMNAPSQVPTEPNIITYFNDYTIATTTARYDFVAKGWNHKTGLECGYANHFGQVTKENDIQRCDRYNYWTAAYYTLGKRWNRWSANMGLRYEFDYTHSIQDAVIRFNKRYHDVLPNVRVGYQVNENLDISATYRRTIVRPSYNQLRSTFYFNVLPHSSLGYSYLSGADLIAFTDPSQGLNPSNSLSPNITYISTDDLATGNPELRPTVTDRVALAAQYRHFTAQLSYRRVDNAIQTVYQLYHSGQMYLSPVNISRMHAWNLDLDYAYSNNKFFVYLLASGTLPHIPVPSLGYMEIENRPFAVVHGNLQYNLLKHLTLGGSVLYSTPWSSGYSRYNSIIGLNLSMMATLCQGRLVLGANYNDVFNRATSTCSDTRYVTVFNRTEVNNDSRSVSLMVRWTFNSISNPFKRRSGNDATLQRTQETVN